MNPKEIENIHHKIFEEIKNIDSDGKEHWTARTLSKVLDYSEYRHFIPVVKRAKKACKSSGHDITNHFEDFLGMVEIGSGAKRKLEDIRLSRYACYLIVQNGDQNKTNVIHAKTYFSQQNNLDLNVSFKQETENVNIIRKIYTIRGVHVMLDKEIALLYEIKPIRLREQVQRNLNRFPEDFMFQLNESEVDYMVSQNAIPSRKYLGGSLPYVFTEQGVASLSGVLKSDKAAEVYVKIMRAFVEMRRFIQNNVQIFARLESVENRQHAFELKTDQNFEKVFQALDQNSNIPKQGIFFDGQVYDAYTFISELIRSAQKSLLLIDNFVDDSVLTLLSKRKSNVSAIIFTRSISKSLALDLKKHNQQYPPITIKQFKEAHDRFIIIDKTEIYHIGASLKDLGKKWFAFSKLERGTLEMLNRIENN